MPLIDAGVVRIYDVLLSKDDCLLATDYRLIRTLLAPEFRKRMGSAEFHYLLGKAAAAAEEEAGLGKVSLPAVAWRAEYP